MCAFLSLLISASIDAISQTFTVSYNSTFARAVPKFLDVYIQGTLSSGFVQPYYQMLRYDWPQNSTFYEFDTKVSSNT